MILRYYFKVRIFKNTWFNRFAGKEGITDGELREMVNLLETELCSRFFRRADMKYKSDAYEALHEETIANFRVGAISEAELREFEKICFVQEGESV